MSALASLTTSLGAARNLGREFFGWWGAELLGLVPARLRRIVLREPNWLFVEVDGDRVSVGATSDAGEKLLWQGIATQVAPEVVRGRLADLAARRAKLIMRLAPQDVLMRRLEFPAAVEPKLRRVLEFELDRQTPFTADQVYFDHDVIGRDSARQRITVELVVVARETVDRLVDLCRAWGVTIDCIAPQSARGLPPRINLLRAAGDGKNRRPTVRFGFVFAVATAALFAAWVGLKLARLDEGVQSAVAQVAKARSEALLVEKIARDAATLDLQAGFLGRKQSVPKLRVLQEVTRLLPDDTWLYHVQIIDREVRIAGYAPNAATLVGVLEASPVFTNARFRAPVTKAGTTGLDRFEISVDIRPDAAS